MPLQKQVYGYLAICINIYIYLILQHSLLLSFLKTIQTSMEALAREKRKGRKLKENLWPLLIIFKFKDLCTYFPIRMIITLLLILKVTINPNAKPYSTLDTFYIDSEQHEPTLKLHMQTQITLRLSIAILEWVPSHSYRVSLSI